MIRLLKFLLTGSWHECRFVLLEQHKVNNYDGNYDHGQLPRSITHTYVSRCSGCGKIHSRTVSV